MREVYLLKSDYTGYYKIGVSKDTTKRLKQLLTGSSENISILHRFKTDIPFKVETALHNFLQAYKVNREWYDLPIEYEFDFIEFCNKTERNIKLVLEKKED